MSGLVTGWTTGTCAAAAAKAAALVLCGETPPLEVAVSLPRAHRAIIPILYGKRLADSAEAAARKDAGDDPDITHGAVLVASVRWTPGGKITFAAGEGVGTVTKPGLSVPPGQPAINPAPRQMIHDAIREVTDRGVQVTISIPGGRELAEKTFNPRLGIVGGLSILGTTGIVRPFSSEALRESLRSALSVAVACGVRSPVFVPGHLGERAARNRFRLAVEQVIEVSNEWGFMVDAAVEARLPRLLALGHPGKLAKLAAGEWDTHSSRSGSALPVVLAAAREALGRALPESPTVEGLFKGLPPDERQRLADPLARRIREAIVQRVRGRLEASVVLVGMQADGLGSAGDLSPWQ
ncbi:MAG: cobalamin biosynthesis protein CbiD [Planctomycetes bacterium]|nr:cobalamin biosynthesis protein CbiD [Planctomycetota bacterium]